MKKLLLVVLPAVLLAPCAVQGQIQDLHDNIQEAIFRADRRKVAFEERVKNISVRTLLE